MYSTSASRCSGVSASAMRSAASCLLELFNVLNASSMISIVESASKYQILSFTTFFLVSSTDKFWNMSTKIPLGLHLIDR